MAYAKNLAAILDKLDVNVQREVAQRIVAEPSSKHYGRLALLAQWRSTAKIAMTLPAEAFTPPPKVQSAVVHLEALDKPRFPADPKTLERVVAAAFNQRRKMMRASLKQVLPDPLPFLETAEIPETARAEEISLEKFCALARAVKAGA